MAFDRKSERNFSGSRIRFTADTRSGGVWHVTKAKLFCRDATANPGARECALEFLIPAIEDLLGTPRQIGLPIIPTARRAENASSNNYLAAGMSRLQIFWNRRM